MQGGDRVSTKCKLWSGDIPYTFWGRVLNYVAISTTFSLRHSVVIAGGHLTEFCEDVDMLMVSVSGYNQSKKHHNNCSVTLP